MNSQKNEFINWVLNRILSISGLFLHANIFKPFDLSQSTGEIFEVISQL